MSDLNSVQLIGRLTRDPELRTTASGTDICSFSLANGRWQKKGEEFVEKSSFFDCTAFGFTGKRLAEKGKKGHRVAITGELEQRSWETEDGGKRSAYQINVRSVQLLEKKPPRNDTVATAEDEVPF